MMDAPPGVIVDLRRGLGQRRCRSFASRCPMGSLSTHVLDTANGCPAADVLIELVRLDPQGSRTLLTSMRTDADGRTTVPVLDGKALRGGSYELVFHVGEYFRGRGCVGAEPAFLDLVPVRFQMTESPQHHHVPLLVSPYGYTTYRGS
jgi:5-hydroxyisourate hydrolase